MITQGCLGASGGLIASLRVGSIPIIPWKWYGYEDQLSSKHVFLRQGPTEVTNMDPYWILGSAHHPDPISLARPHILVRPTETMPVVSALANMTQLDGWTNWLKAVEARDHISDCLVLQPERQLFVVYAHNPMSGARFMSDVVTPSYIKLALFWYMGEEAHTQINIGGLGPSWWSPRSELVNQDTIWDRLSKDDS